METIVTPETQVRDPVCGMTVTPKTAAGTSTRDGETYYFCSSGCKTQFDTGADAQHAHTADEGTHAHHGVAGVHAHAGVETEAHATQTEEAQERAYRTLMAKFWLALSSAFRCSSRCSLTSSQRSNTRSCPGIR